MAHTLGEIGNLIDWSQSVTLFKDPLASSTIGARIHCFFGRP